MLAGIRRQRPALIVGFLEVALFVLRHVALQHRAATSIARTAHTSGLRRSRLRRPRNWGGRLGVCYSHEGTAQKIDLFPKTATKETRLKRTLSPRRV
jgi:hypothetical protein